MHSVSKSRLFLAMSLAVGITSVANAQATRTWVSGVGDDVNPCSRTAPCKTFAGAISKTAAGGEIDALDPGGFGAVTITKAMTIDGGAGQNASSLASGTTAFTISSSNANDVITIRNVSINGATSGQSTGGLNGIRLVTSSGIAPKALHIENVSIFGFNRGISIENTAGSGLTKVFVDRCTIRNNVNEGIAELPAGQGNLTVSRSVINENGTIGISVGGSAVASVTNTVINGDVIGVQTASGTRLNMADSLVSFNSNTGLNVLSGSTAFLSGNSIMSNAIGVTNAGTVTGFTNNGIGGNGTDVSGTAIVSVAGK